ncbi:MAG: glycosyl hydrolase family 28 protein [Clostridia bacterium]|nr:glycosyl hydrolase family 28 protein [Clostridia bacterium]
MEKFIYKSSGRVGSQPETPIVSRFVSPWDTSGWYSVLPDFAVGSAVRSNTDETVLSAPAYLDGGDYIMTFNSNAEGFDDKQGMDFYVEREACVYIAFPSAIGECLPDGWADKFDRSDDVIVTNKCEYALYSRAYHAGDLVHTDDVSGDFYHYFVIVCTTDEEKAAEATTLAPVDSADIYAKNEYKSYINDVFNGDTIDGYTVRGDVSTCRRENDENDGYVRINGAGSIEKMLAPHTDRIVISALVTPGEDGAYAVCALGNGEVHTAGVLFDGGKISAVSSADAAYAGEYECGREYAVKLIYDRAAGSFDVWLDCRLAVSGVEAGDEASEVGFYADGGSLCIDNVAVYDDTEVFVLDEDFSHGGDGVCDYPFADKKSLHIEKGSRTFPFASVIGEVTAEVKIKSLGDGYSAVSLIGRGGEAVRVATFKNNLYVTDGDVWMRVYAGLNDWMYYPCDNWMNIKISADTSSGTCDVWVDGAMRARGLRFMNDNDSLCAVGVDTQTGAYVGRVRVYDAYDLGRDVIPAGKIYNVRDYGAVGDGKAFDMPAVQKALDDAAYSGGTVYFPAGEYLTGELFLHSDETVFVSRRATIVGTNDHGKYPLQIPGPSLCAHRQLGRGLIYGHKVKNVRITGGGMLNGQGRYRFKMNDPLPDRRVEDARPDLVYITYSSDIIIENINFRNSAFWTVVPLSSDRIFMRNLNLDCMNTPNRDGIDPVDCSDMTIYGCNIMAGDDGLCFKSSDVHGCKNIEVHDMMIQSLASGIKFGTDTYYSLENAHISDCTVKNVNRCGISLETVDGAVVRNVVFERIDMTDVGAPAYVTVGARNRLPRGIDTVRRSEIDGVTFRELRFDKPYPFSFTKQIREVMVVGQSAEQKIRNVTFDNCRFELDGGYDTVPPMPRTIDNRYPEYDRHGLSSGYAFTVRFAENFRTERCDVRLKKTDVRQAVVEYVD